VSDYIKESISKEELSDAVATDALLKREAGDGGSSHAKLKHGEWLHKARKELKSNIFATPAFALLVIFALLFAGTIYLFEQMPVMTGSLYAVKVIVTTLFAVSLGFILSVWWSKGSRFDARIREAERIDVEYRELLMSFSDSLFDIINALNTLSSKPPQPFVVATDFLLGEYVHLLQSRLQRYGDYIAGLGFDATDFLDEKIRIFEGIRERASLSIEGMPKELEHVFVQGLNLDVTSDEDWSALRQQRLRSKLDQLGEENTDAPD
jgi:hypothetical protein